MSAIATVPAPALAIALTSTADPVGLPSASAGARYNRTVIPASGFETSKYGADRVVELLTRVMLSAGLAPVSLAASRSGAGAISGGLVSMVIGVGLVLAAPRLEVRTRGTSPTPETGTVTAADRPRPAKFPVKSLCQIAELRTFAVRL